MILTLYDIIYQEDGISDITIIFIIILPMHTKNFTILPNSSNESIYQSLVLVFNS